MKKTFAKRKKNVLLFLKYICIFVYLQNYQVREQILLPVWFGCYLVNLVYFLCYVMKITSTFEVLCLERTAWSTS